MNATGRLRNVLDFTLSSLLRRKWRNAALLIVYTAVVFMLASVMFFTHALKREAASVLKDAPEMVVQRMKAGRHDLMPLAYLDEIRGVRGVSDVRGRLWGYYYDPAVGANYTLMVPGGDEATYKSLEAGGIVIGNGIARSRLAGVGDTMPFRAHTGKQMNLRVQSVLKASSELVSADLVLMSEEDFRALFGIDEGFVTDIALTVKNPAELATVAGKIVRRLPDARPIVRDEMLRTYDAVFSWRGGVMVAVLSVAVLAFIIFAWDRASGLSAEERREIGVLKAVGWETSDVILMKSFEGVAVSLLAFLLGVMLAYGHVFFASSVLFGPVLKGWSVLYPEFRLLPSVDAFELATLFFLTVAPYTIATIVPSWRAATIDPDTVMRT